jgi:hypothetical protein
LRGRSSIGDGCHDLILSEGVETLGAPFVSPRLSGVLRLRSSRPHREGAKACGEPLLRGRRRRRRRSRLRMVCVYSGSYGSPRPGFISPSRAAPTGWFGELRRPGVRGERDPAACDREGPDAHPAWLRARRPRLQAQGIETANVARGGDLLGLSGDDHAPTSRLLGSSSVIVANLGQGERRRTRADPRRIAHNY